MILFSSGPQRLKPLLPHSPQLSFLPPSHPLRPKKTKMPSAPLLGRLGQTYLGHPFRALVAAAKVLAAGHLAITYFYSWGTVSGPSMLPAWEVWGEGAVVSHLYRRGVGVRVGDLVKFKVPVTDADGIKRVAGLPGDYILVHSADSGRDEMMQVRLYIRIYICLYIYFPSSFLSVYLTILRRSARPSE